MKKILTFAFLAFIFEFNLIGQSYFPPPHGFEWKKKSLEYFKINIKKFNSAIDFAKENEYSGSKDLRIAISKGFENEPYHKILGPTKKRGGSAGIILKEGYKIASWGDTKRVDMTFSVTKSYLSTIAGLAVDQKILKTDDFLSDYIWDNSFKGEHNSKIRWEYLLNQSSDWSGTLWGIHDWADRPPAEGGIDDWRNRRLNTPGTVYKYNDVRVNLLAYCLLNVWRQPIPQILKKFIMDPIGASTTWRWYGYNNSWVELDGNRMQSVSGGGHSGGGLFINTEDHARFGLLFLRLGKWNERQLLSQDWINKATQSSPSQKSYGYMWWLNKKGTERYWDGVPEDTFYASGFGGNYIIIVPEKDLVVVLRWLEPTQVGVFMKKLICALP